MSGQPHGGRTEPGVRVPYDEGTNENVLHEDEGRIRFVHRSRAADDTYLLTLTGAMDDAYAVECCLRKIPATAEQRGEYPTRYFPDAEDEVTWVWLVTRAVARPVAA
ncbi:hypothetical protein [Streptomyces sp. NPDC050507]|uniref:hypothetical protein n=1 Tax=Streptomyces sp. NPDC050507 TaxID=3365619 RepID=UPI0037AE7922